MRSTDATSVVLILKKGEVENLKGFRLINLAGGLYKWLAKVFVVDLKGLLAKVVIEALNAFMDKGRFWMFVFLAN